MQPKRRTNVVFTVVLSVVMAVCAIVVAAYMILVVKAPAGIVIGTMLAAIPVIPLVLCYLWLDRYEPEPKSLLALGLGWGAFVAIMVALIVEGSASIVVHGKTGSAVIVAPLAEEAGKGSFMLLLLLFRRQEFDGILDGIVYAGMTGIGFAFVENIEYLGHAYAVGAQADQGLNVAVHLFILRCVFSPFAHPMFTSLTGIGIGIAIGARNPAVKVIAPIIGYICACGAHATWNGVVATAHSGGDMILRYVVVMVPAFFMLVAFAVWARSQEGKMMTTALGDAARRGYLDPAEVPWLVRLAARTRARRYAAGVAGPQAKKVMAEYQSEAIELAFLHNRFLRGTQPKDADALGNEYVTRMRSLRPLLLWPRTQNGALPDPHERQRLHGQWAARYQEYQQTQAQAQQQAMQQQVQQRQQQQAYAQQYAQWQAQHAQWQVGQQQPGQAQPGQPQPPQSWQQPGPR